MMKRIQTEIRIADLLALVETQSVKFYLCHNVAYLIKDKLADNDGFAKYMNAHAAHVNKCGYDEEYNSGYYYYIYQNHPIRNSFCEQVVGQLNAYIKKIFPDIDVETGYALAADKITNYILNRSILKTGAPYYGDFFNLTGRIKLLELILEIDPEAVISINL